MVATSHGRGADVTLQARFLRDPTGVVVPTIKADPGINNAGVAHAPSELQDSAANHVGGIQPVVADAAANAAVLMEARKAGTGAGASPGVPLEVLAIGENLSDEVRTS